MSWKQVVVLMLLLVAASWPTFVFASNISGDEFLKSGTATASVLAIYTAWVRNQRANK